MIINNEFKTVLNSRMFQNNYGKVFDTPLAMLEPSLKSLEDYVTNDNYRLKYTIGSINRNEDSSANVAYDKLIVEFKLNTYVGTDDYSNICVVYNLSTKIPTFKVAAGKTLTTCLNMCVWADTDVYVTDDVTKIGTRINKYLADLADKQEEYDKFRTKLEETILNTDKLQTTIGKIIYNSSDSVLKSAVINASSDLQNSKSPYYIAEADTTLWNVYNSITQQFSDKFEKSFIDVPKHTLGLTKILYN
jgi:hypothetical protein